MTTGGQNPLWGHGETTDIGALKICCLGLGHKQSVSDREGGEDGDKHSVMPSLIIQHQKTKRDV